MKTFQQFQLNSQQLDENLRPLVKGASYLMRKLANTKVKNIAKIPNIKKSDLMRKLANTKVKNITNIPNVKKSDLSQYAMYHGTTKKSADKIMKSGFKPSKDSVMNLDRSIIKKKNRAFATTDPEVAKVYADRAAKRTGGKPEILAVKVRDSKLYQPLEGIHRGEYYIKTKKMKPVARGVKPIEIRKGQVVQEARVDKLLKYFGDDAIKMLRNKRFLPKIVNQDGANKLRQFKHLKRRGVSGKFPNFTPKDTPDKYSKLAVKRKSIYPPDVDAAETQIGDMRINIGDKKIARRREKERLLRRMFEKGDK